jgi:hypothetical protein
VVRCHYVDYGGDSYGIVERGFHTPYFEGERDIRSLDIYPIRFAENHERVLEELHEQGKKFQTCLASKHLSYQGWTLTCDPLGDRVPDSKGDKMKNPEHIDSDVIVDFDEAFQTYPDWKPKFIQPGRYSELYPACSDFHPIKQWSGRDRRKLVLEVEEFIQENEGANTWQRNEYIEKDEFIISCKGQEGNEAEKKKQELRKEELILLPRRLFAYTLRDRKFAQVDIRYLKPIAGCNGFDSLILPGNYKQMVQALVDSHFVKKKIEKIYYRDSLDQDVVAGKGRGLVILLHGVPGVGKTSTAETVAQVNKKPLFAITCGDLGFTPSDVESSLGEIFRLAHLWDCVLLLDEADIFLSQRSKFDLKRNALVSGRWKAFNLS